MRKIKNPPPPSLDQDKETSQVEVEDLLKSIDDKFDRSKDLMETLNIISDKVADCTKTLEDYQKQADKLKNELKSIVFPAKLTDESLHQWGSFFENVNRKQKEELRRQYEQQREKIDQLMADYLRQFDAMQKENIGKLYMLILDTLKKLEQNKGAWLSNKIFWWFTLAFAILIALSTWVIGYSLINGR